MLQYHPQAELGPRDIVARAILSERIRSGSPVYLDLRHLGKDYLRQRFPTVTAKCREYGLEISTDLIPVEPAAHYLIGGIKVDLYGRTAVNNLFAVGEVASTGVHGANRLASNSRLKGWFLTSGSAGYRRSGCSRPLTPQPSAETVSAIMNGRKCLSEAFVYGSYREKSFCCETKRE